MVSSTRCKALGRWPALPLCRHIAPTDGVSAARPPAAVPLRRRSAAVPSAYGNYAMLLWLPDCFVLFTFFLLDFDNVWLESE